VLSNWRWWLVVLLAALTVVLVELISAVLFSTQTWVAELNLGVVKVVDMGIWLLLLGWLAVLFDRQPSPKEEQLLSLGLSGTEDKGQ
jgi:hypothetical protein